MTDTNWQPLWDQLPADLRDKLKANPKARISEDDAQLMSATAVALWPELNDSHPIAADSLFNQPVRGSYLVPKFWRWIEGLA